MQPISAVPSRPFQRSSRKPSSSRSSGATSSAVRLRDDEKDIAEKKAREHHRACGPSPVPLARRNAGIAKHRKRADQKVRALENAVLDRYAYIVRAAPRQSRQGRSPQDTASSTHARKQKTHRERRGGGGGARKCGKQQRNEQEAMEFAETAEPLGEADIGPQHAGSRKQPGAARAAGRQRSKVSGGAG